MSTPLLFTLALLVYLCPQVSNAQKELPYGSAQNALLPEWAKLMYGPSPDPAQVITSYTDHYASRPFVKDGHTQYFKRWMRSIARELPPLKTPRNRQAQNRSVSAQWQSIGPWDWDHDAADRSYAPGAAHVYTIEQARSNPDILLAGTATAGIWKSVDRGTSWHSVSDDLRTRAVTALEINHQQPQSIYAGLLNSIYRSTDGGGQWSPTGNSAFQNLELDIRDILMHPQDTSTLYAATHQALYKTTDNGIMWTLIMPGDFLEIEFHPINPDTVYTVRRVGNKTEFYRALDGVTFQVQSSGWPTPNLSLQEHQRRTEIAVTPDAPDHVYALATGETNGGSGLYGVYVSTDAGHTWIFTCCGPQPAGPPSADNPNLMGWSDLGLEDGGQYYYDLAFAVSPTNADSIYVGGVNLWVSGDGGASFVCPAKWSHPQKPNYVHADIHDIHFYAHTQEIWLACDGGIFCSTDEGASFVRKMSGISATDFWGFGMGYWDGDVMLGGTYHNGTMLKDNDVYISGWLSTDGGDNFRGFVNPGKPKEVLSDYNIKMLSGDRLVNNSVRPFAVKPNATYSVGESSDLLFHPEYFGTWYCGSGKKLWKTTDDGINFTTVHDFGVKVASMAISWSNPDVMYVCTWPGWWNDKRIYRSDDAGKSWIEITPPASVIGGNTWVPYDIAVDANDPMKVWIVRTSMYGDTDLNGVSVFTSDNGGQSWQNITTATLNNEAFTCIMHQYGTDGGVYLGTRETVFYRNASMTDWSWYGQDLPEATFSTKLVPYYRKGKMRNGTNRSVWESPFYESSVPLARASVFSRLHNCPRDTVYFMDHSVVHENGAEWLWQFPGGTPSVSKERNPKVLYHRAGIYDVTLIVSDVNGIDSNTVNGMIEVRNQCRAEPTPGRALKCTLSPDYVNVPDLGVTGNAFTITAWVRPTGIQANNAAIVMSDGIACGLNFREGNNTLGYHWAGNSQAWSWDSNLEVPPDLWSHVAIVVSATSVSLYVNGRPATHIISHPAVSLSSMKIGSYQEWQTRNYNGLIDEVTIWNRSLTQEEIRATRHLTRIPEDDPSLLAYYQFNADNSTVYDRANTHHGVMHGGATKVRSRAPVGSGVSQSMNILLTGTYDFDKTGLTLSFPLVGVAPIGEVYVSRLYVLPDTLMAGMAALNNGYWIINNYGTNLQITSPNGIALEEVGFISESMQGTAQNAFYYRGENAELGGWQPGSMDNGELNSGLCGRATYSDISSGFTQLGQVYAVRDSMSMGKPKVAITHPSDSAVMQRGGSSVALALQSPCKGLLLPQYSSAELQSIPSPAEGSVVYVTDLKRIVCFDRMYWQVLNTEYLGLPVLEGEVETLGVTFGVVKRESAILGLGKAAGVLVLSSFTENNIVDIDYPKEGLLIYRSDLGRVAYYDGVDWIHPSVADGFLPASSDNAAQNLPGISIGTGVKDPNALLQIMDPNRALGIPVAEVGDVIGPHAGLIVFDPVLRGLCVFDGVCWSIIK